MCVTHIFGREGRCFVLRRCRAVPVSTVGTSMAHPAFGTNAIFQRQIRRGSTKECVLWRTLDISSGSQICCASVCIFGPSLNCAPLRVAGASVRVTRRKAQFIIDMAQSYFISKAASYGATVLHICVSKYFVAYSSIFKTAINASLGTDTVPKDRMRFLPSFCFSSSFFFRVMSPP